MARPQRKRLEFTEESANKLLQEIYDESHNIKAKITRLFTKWEQKVKEGGEIAAIGDQIIKLINAESKNQYQKIMLLKFLNDIVFANGKPSNNSSNSGLVNKNEVKADLDSERKAALMDMVEEALSKKEQEKSDK